SWASERFPWLVLHPLLPLILLAAIGGQWLWDRRRRLLPAAGLAASALGIAYLVVAGFGAALLRPADPSEMLVYTQSSVDVPPITQELARMDESQRRSGGAPLGVDIDSAYGAAWPWAWYLRDYQRAGYVDMSLPGYSPTAQVLLVTDLNHGSLAPKLGRYTGRRFQLRVWWLPEFKRAGVTDWAQWLAWRRPWSPKGSFDEWILVRDDVGQGR
ncbi:MAG: hypothetical protein M3O87_08375, partial [Candidatus Dormibacteraeota bacterium]|nr:hypothetical protein [Candidatus Dormibacteraeota bacterium]